MADPHRDAIRGEEAKRLLNDELLREAFRAVEERLIHKLAQLDTPKDEVERLHLALAMGRRYQEYLKQVAYTGTLAHADLVAERERKKSSMFAWR